MHVAGPQKPPSRHSALRRSSPGTNHNSPSPLPTPVAQNVSSGNTSLVFKTLAADAQLKVRAEYFGLCVSGSGINGWRSSTSADTLAGLLPVPAPGSAPANTSKAEDGDGANPADPLGLIYLADEFPRRVVSPSLLYARLALDHGPKGLTDRTNGLDSFAPLMFAALCASIVCVYGKSDPPREGSDQPTLKHLPIHILVQGTPRTEDPVSENLWVVRMPLHARWMLGMSGGVSTGLALLGIFWQHLCSATAVTLFRAVTW